MVSNHPAKSGGHKHSGSRDIVVFFCHVTLKIKALYDFMVRSSSKVSRHPAKFGGHRHCGTGDIMILVCQVVLQDQVIKGSCDFLGKNPSRQVTILQRLVAITSLVVEL